MTDLSDDTLLTRSEQAAGSRVGDETVILHLGSGTYFGLDPVGTRVWELLAEPRGLTGICARMEGEFDVAPEVLRADVAAFLRSLLENDLVAPTG
jgi:hypothetical protein